VLFGERRQGLRRRPHILPLDVGGHRLTALEQRIAS
jgi:hypothetical protein